MLISVALPFAWKEGRIFIKSELATSFNKRLFKIIIAFIVVGSFWAIYEISHIAILDLGMRFSENLTLNIPQSYWTSVSSTFTLPICIAAAFMWSFFYYNQFLKLTIGFIMAFTSLGLLLFIPSAPSDEHVLIYVISMLFLVLSEIHIGPIFYSILTKYSNPKYLAIMISLGYVPTAIFFSLIGKFSDEFYDSPSFTLKFAFASSCIIGATLILCPVVIKVFNSAAK